MVSRGDQNPLCGDAMNPPIRKTTRYYHAPYAASTVLRLRRTTKPNRVAWILMAVAPLFLVASLVGSLWLPTLLGLPTYVVGAIATLLAIGVAHLNTRIDYAP